MFRPQGTYVSFRPVAAGDTSKGGIVLTDQPKRAQVVAIGPGKVLSNGHTKYVTVKPGDYIVMTSNAFIQELMVNGERVYYVDQDFIAGTLDESDVMTAAPAGGQPSRIIAPETPSVGTADDLEFVKVGRAN